MLKHRPLLFLFRMRLERRDDIEHLGAVTRLLDIGDLAAAAVSDAGLGDLFMRDHVGRIDVLAADDAGDLQVAGLKINSHFLMSGNHQITVRQHLSDDRGDLEVDRFVSSDLTGVGTVLLVEDEDAVRLFASRALKNKGYAVIEAKNGEKAMEAIELSGRRLDLLITDVMMPAMDGPTLVKAVREKFPDLKVIFISGYAEDTFREKVENDTAIHFLPKPFSLLQLAGKVKQVMGEDVKV